jgi:hypothetical protein
MWSCAGAQISARESAIWLHLQNYCSPSTIISWSVLGRQLLHRMRIRQPLTTSIGRSLSIACSFLSEEVLFVRSFILTIIFALYYDSLSYRLDVIVWISQIHWRLASDSHLVSLNTPDKNQSSLGNQFQIWNQIEIPFPNVIFPKMIFRHVQFFVTQISNVAAKYLHILRQCIKKRLLISRRLYFQEQLPFVRLLKKYYQVFLPKENMFSGFFGNWCKLLPSSQPFLFENH